MAEVKPIIDKKSGIKFSNSDLRGTADLLSTYDAKDKIFLVMDIGTENIKIGFSGEDFPRIITPSVVAQPRAEKMDDLTAPKLPVLYGSPSLDLGDKKDSYRLIYPTARRPKAQKDLLRKEENEKEQPEQLSQKDMEIKRMGKFFTKEAEENFMRMCLHFFENELALDPTQINLLILDSPGYSRDYRNKLAEIFFEGLKINSIDFMNTGVTSIFSSGRTEGLSIEIGHSCHSIVPVYSGYPLYHASHCTNLAGQDVYDFVTLYLKDKLPIFDRFDCDRSIILKEIKEKKATCCLDFEKAVSFLVSL